jgi:hypothetical protein
MARPMSESKRKYLESRQNRDKTPSSEISEQKLGSMSSLFSNVYSIEPTYIHSHIENFEKGLISNRDMQEKTFSGILKELKEAIVVEIESQYNYFLKLESLLLSELQKKHPNVAPKNREEFIQRHKELSKIFKNKDATIYNFGELKANLDTGKLNAEVKKTVDTVTGEILKQIKSSPPKRENKEKPQNYQNRLKAWNEQIKQAEKIDVYKEVTKEVDLRLKKREPEIKKIINSLIAPLNQIINYVGTQLSYFYQHSDESTEKGRLKTYLEGFFRIFEQLLGDTSTDDEYKELFNYKKDVENIFTVDSEKFKNFILSRDPNQLIRALTITKNFDFYNETVENLQLSAKLGDIYEAVIRDTILDIIQKDFLGSFDDSVASIFLNAEDVKLGASALINYEKSTTIDIETQKLVVGNTPVYFGFSAKLKEGAQTVDLEDTPIEQYLVDLNYNIGQEKSQYIQYIRNNILGLNAFSVLNKEEASTISSISHYFNLYNEFEKEVIFLAIIVKYLLGIVRKVSEDQKDAIKTEYVAVDRDTGQPVNALFLTSFIITQDSIYSTVDILGFLLKQLKGNSSLKEINQNLKSRFKERGLVITASPLKLLWSKKQEYLSQASKAVTYQGIASSSEVKGILADLSKAFGLSSYSQATFSMGREQLERMTGK